MITKFKLFEEVENYEIGDYVLLNLNNIPAEWGLSEFAKIQNKSQSKESDDYFSPLAFLTTCLSLKRNEIENFWLNLDDFIRKLTPEEIKEYDDKEIVLSQLKKYNL